MAKKKSTTVGQLLNDVFFELPLKRQRQLMATFEVIMDMLESGKFRPKVYGPTRDNIERLIAYKIGKNEAALRANPTNPPKINVSYTAACARLGIDPERPGVHMPRLKNRFQDPSYWPDPEEIPEIPDPKE